MINTNLTFCIPQPAAEHARTRPHLACILLLLFLSQPYTLTHAADYDLDGISDEFDVDTDNDTIPDVYEGLIDSDNDGTPDYLDLDSDNDGLSDVLESGGVDRDNNGRIDQFVDINRNGYQDSLQGSPLAMRDQDNDGFPDHLDLDSNNDGVFDIKDAGFPDSDNNGIRDANPSPLSSNETTSPPAASPPTAQIDASLDSQTSSQSNEQSLVLVTGLDGNAHGGVLLE